MAKQTKANELPFTDRTSFYSDLAYIAPSLKNEYWAAEVIFFSKKNYIPFLDHKRAAAYRATDRLELDAKEYKQMVDPVTPMDSGGDAKYFASDWKANPIYIHLKNIVKADIQRTAKEIECNFTDKFAKTRKMRDNNRLVYQNAFRQLINEYAPLIGLEGISDKQDPYKWVENLVNNKGAAKNPTPEKSIAQPTPKEEQGKPDAIDSYIDLIKNQISDSQDLAIYNELVYKGDYEMAVDLGIKHYMLNQNKWLERWSDEFLDDIMHFNKACGEWYTDEITGRPVIERFVPELLRVSPFKRRDGEDLMGYYIEYDISFADFIKTAGKNLPPQKLKDVFEYNKTQGTNHGLTWQVFLECSSIVRDSTKIRLGRCAILTQDYDVDLTKYQANYPRINTADISWESMTDGNKPEGKHYNVWYSFYYLPPSQTSLSNADFTWQSQFIFDIKKNQDQFRFGESGRYSKSPMVIFNNGAQASFSDITQSWMPKIHHAYHKFQNCLINDFDAVTISDEFLGSLLSAVDEDNKIATYDKQKPTGGNGRDAAMQQWKMMKQGGTGFLKMTDKNGVPIANPATFVVPIRNQYLEKAEKWLIMIASMYDQMTKALAFSDAGEGQDVKPRTPVAALQESIKSSKNATWFIQKGYEEFLKGYAERFVRYILMICGEPRKYGYHDRFEEFKNVIGEANGLMIEGLEDIPPESIGLTINYVDNSQKKDLVSQICIEYMKNGQIDEDFLYLIMGVDNWKYMFALLRLGIKKRKTEKAHEEELAQERIMEQKKMDLQIAQALNQAKAEGKNSNIQTQGQIDAAIAEQDAKNKHNSQMEIKDKIKNNKLEEESHMANLNLQKPAGQPA